MATALPDPEDGKVGSTMSKVAAGEQARRLRLAAEILAKARTEHRVATIREAQVACGVSDKTAKKLLELAANIVLHEGATEALMMAPGVAPKPARKKAVPQVKQQAPRSVDVTVMGPLPRVLPLANPFAWGERFEYREGQDPVGFDAGALLKGNIAELGEAMARLKSDMQIMRFWVFGSTEEEPEGKPESARNFPPRPQTMFGPYGTPIDVANLEKVNADILAKISKALAVNEDIEQRQYERSGFKWLMNTVNEIMDIMIPDRKLEFSKHLREATDAFRRGF
jgi:hypothetical protein